MILKGNMLKLTIPFFWAVQSIWLLSFKSIETFIAGKSSVSCPLKPSDSAPLC